MNRRKRSERRKNQEVFGGPSPYIKRNIPFFDILDEEQLQIIEGQVDWLIENIGIAFRNDPTALSIWQKAGIKPCGEYGDLIRADAKLIRKLCSFAPSEFTQHARNPNRSVTIGGVNQVFAPIYGAPFVRDLKGGRRYAKLEDFQKLVKLTFMHPNLHHGSFVIAEPTDIPVSQRHLDMMLAHMILSDKPHLGAITEKSRAQDAIDMVEIVFGADKLKNDVCIMANVNTNSP